MKPAHIFVFVIFIVSHLAHAQNNEVKTNQVTVFGSVVLKETANEASLSFSVKGTGSTLRQAVEHANTKTIKVTDKLTHLGVLVQNIFTSEFYSGENIGDKTFLSSSRDYKAIIKTTIKIDSIKLLQPVLFAISEEEVENMSSIYFSLKDEVGLRRRARVEAGIKAREKAEDIAKGLGVTIGKVLFFEETQSPQILANQNYPNPFNPSTNSVFEKTSIDESRGSGFFAQTISATAQVKVAFELK